MNGSPVADASCPAGVSDSDSVTFCPYRSSTQSDTVGGEWPIPEAPIAQTDPPNCTHGRACSSTRTSRPTTRSSARCSAARLAGDGLSGATPSAKKTAQLSAYMQAVADAINANPGTTGQRVAVKLYQSGTSVLGVPFYVMVVGTPDNIANLDAGRNDAAFWRGVIDGTTSQTAALAAVDTRPAFGWITGTPHGNEPAGGEGSTKELYELVARTDCANSQRLDNLDVFIQPVTAPDDRDHNVRTTGVGSRPEPGSRRGGDAGEPGAADLHRDVPGPLLHRRAPAVVGLLLPAQRGRGAERDLALRARPDQRRDRAGHPAVVQRPERRSTATTTPTTCSSPSTATRCPP